ncbi:MAG TPA: hypothetical protein VNU48_04400 [Burkholderiaceae bacterium]|nr:hypothetical protein [Burkholderiaceae bacterium]
MGQHRVAQQPIGAAERPPLRRARDAQAALESVVAVQVGTAEDPSAQIAVASTLETLDYLKLALFRSFGHMVGSAAAGAPAPLHDRLLYRYQSARVADLCAEQVSKLFQACGAGGVYLNRPLVRRFLDIHTARSHVANHAARAGTQPGRLLHGPGQPRPHGLRHAP